jgi:uncharacterized protein
MEVIHAILSVPLLTFILGIIATLIRSDLEIPRSVGKFISLYLLFTIGFRGGAELAHSLWDIQTSMTVAIGLLMALITPLYVFFLVKKKLSLPNAGAVAASYGSISIVTFMAATSYLHDYHIPYGGHMVALVALMEFPAILIGLLLIRIYDKDKTMIAYTYTSILKEVFRNGSILLLLGSLLIGYWSSPAEVISLHPFIVSIQKGMLLFFLLDMGLLVGSNIAGIQKRGLFMLAVGIGIPLMNAAIGLLLTYLLHINLGDSLVLVVLLASASYIAVPAAFRLTVPTADPSLYLATALVITFPFNIMMIPFYGYVLNYLASL